MLSKYFLYFLAALALLASAQSQTARGVLTGRVTDPTGAAIPGATVRVTDSAQKPTTVTTDAQGRYRVADLDPGAYMANASSPGFSTRASSSIKISAGQTATLDIALSIEMEQQNVTVTDEPAAIETNPANNASATIVQGKALDALSDDPDELQVDLMAMAGVAAGPNGPQMFIDGFSGGQPPPKSAIREIRINQNPFSAQYDAPGEGRIEILTKPGADHWHGRVQVTGNDEAFNAQNPFLDSAPPGYYSVTYNAQVGGALTKKASFSFDMFRRNIQDLAVIDTPGAIDLGILPVNTAVDNPKTRMSLDPRFDYQISPSNTLSMHYAYWRDADSNSGLGQFSLPSLAYNTLGTEQSFRVSDTQTVGAFFENEIRFRFERDADSRNALSTAPTLNVEGYFNGGGNSQGTGSTASNHYEFQNYSSINHKKHQIGFGVRLRHVTENSYSTSGFNGTFIFNSAADYVAGNPYQFTQTALLPGGSPNTGVSLSDVGLYVQDDWKVMPNLTLSGGLRFESQTSINDRADWAPRFGLAWGIGRKHDAAKTVLRAGWGIFYDRFTEDLLLNAARLDGTRQQSYVLYGTADAPLSFYPNLPTAAELQNAQSSIATTYQISPRLRSPYMMQTSIGIEQQVTKKGNISISYVNSRGVHQFYTNNINAPLPSTYNYLDPTSLTGADRPNGINSNIFEYESDGIYRQNQLLLSGNIRAGSKLTIFSHYALNAAHSDAVGPNSFPSNPYNILQDYGRAAFDSRHHLFVGGMVGLPHSFQLSPFLNFNSGKPYNIVLGQDLNGSTVLNQRPALASALSNPANVVNTQFGSFDTVPVAGETPIPYNYLDGPSFFSLNLRLSKTFGFGGVSEDAGKSPPAEGHRPSMPRASDKRYQIVLSVNARNIFNVVNEGTPAAILNPPHRDPSNANTILPASVSPLFGRANSLANNSTANRILYLSAGFNF